MTRGVRRIGAGERRARLAARHHLAPWARAGSVAAVAEDLIGLHGTDPASVYLAAWARTSAVDSAAIEHALYEERVLVRMLGMRRTMFVVPVSLAPLVQAACTDEVAQRLRRTLAGLLRDGGVADDAAGWLTEVCDATVQALTALGGTATGAELARAEPRLGQQVMYAEGKSYGGLARISSQMLMLLSAEGRIVRGRPRGGWTSSQFQWHLPGVWLGRQAGAGRLPAAEARTELARRWLRTFGPAAATDLQWWAGWTGGQVKAALAGLSVTEVDLDGTPGLMLAGDDGPDGTGPDGTSPDGTDADGTEADATGADGTEADGGREPGTAVPGREPWPALLPALDPTAMGWRDRRWFLGEHRPALFDRSGNIGPTVWWDGRIVGGWAQRKDGEIVYRLLEDVGAGARAAIGSQAGLLAQWLGRVRVTPRFRTPLERELTG